MKTLIRLTMLASLVVLGGTASAFHDPDTIAKGLPGPLVGVLEVTNQRHRPVEVYVDGRFALEVPAESTRLIPDVPNGVRLVSYGTRRGGYATDRVEVRVDRRVALRIAPLSGFLTVRNGSGLPMKVMVGDIDLGVLAPNREITSPALPAGSYVVTAMSREPRVRPQQQDVVVQPGETALVSLRPVFASLRIDNPFPHPVSVFVDGRRETRLQRFDSLVIPDLEPGRVSLEMRHRGMRLASEWMELMAGAEVRWTPRVARTGQLELYNPTQSNVRVSVSGQELNLRPGERQSVTLDAGPHRVQLMTRDGRTVVHQVVVPLDRTERFEVPRVWMAGSSNYF